MTIFHAVLILIATQRGGELLLARANTALLLCQGAIEIDRAGYKWLVLLHTGWLATLAVMVPAATTPRWPLLAAFVLLQGGRIWVIATLGRRWTTRLIVPPGTPPVSSGPYRWLNHPNYLIVTGEIAILPLAFDAVAIAAGFSACNALLLARRIRLEQVALGLPSYHKRETLPRRG
jgi:methyltransferase